MGDPLYSHPDYPRGVDVTTLRSLEPDDQADVMRFWFSQNYEDPAQHTAYESAEGGYIFIWGGPYDAQEELDAEFGELVPEDVIGRLADELSRECVEWTKHPEYDEDLFDAVSANPVARVTLQNALTTITALQQVSAGQNEAALTRLLYANVIAALETYLSDRFINAVFKDDSLLELFVKTNPDLQKRSLKYSEVFQAAATVREEVKAYLLDVVWHNVGKVEKMYHAVFGVSLGPHLGNVSKAISIRHDIVHRNGVTKDGKRVELSADDLRGLISHVTALADFVELQMPPPPVEGDLEDLPFV